MNAFTARKSLFDQAGYVYIYLSNEEDQPLEVYFDDFRVEHVKSNVVQMDDYYPFGATFNSHSRENTLPQKFLYQEKEWLDNLNLALYDFEWRWYDPFVSRTTTMDPHGDDYENLSPYSWAANNPISIIDPNGMDIINTAIGTTYTGADAQTMFVRLQLQQGNARSMTSDSEEKEKSCFSCGYSYFTDKTEKERVKKNQGGFWNGVRGFGDGLWAGGESTVDFFASLGTKEGWVNMAEGFGTLGEMMSPIPNSTKIQLGMATTNYVQNVPNMSAYEMGYDIGYGTEKLAETILLSKGAGASISFARNLAFSRSLSFNPLRFQLGLRYKPTNFMIRLERAFRSPVNKGLADGAINATHINIAKPGSFNYHLYLNPFKWKYFY